MTRRCIVPRFALLSLLLAGGPLVADETRTVWIHDQQGARQQVDTRPAPAGAVVTVNPTERDQIIWHRNIPAIYYATDIAQAQRIFAGAWSGVEMHAVDGNGTPLWEVNDSQTYTAAARDADRFASVTIDDAIAGATIHAWQEGDATPLWTRSIPDCGVPAYCLQVSPDGAVVAIALYMTGPGVPRLLNLDAANGAIISSFDGASGTPRALVISDDGSLVAVRFSTIVHVIKTATGTERWSVGVGASADPLAMSGDGALLASGWSNMLVFAWNGEIYETLWSHNGGGSAWYLRQCAFSADGSALVAAWYTTSYNQNKVEWFDPANSTPLWTYTPAPSGGSYQDIPATLAVDATGQFCAVGAWGDEMNQNPELTVFHRDSRTPLFTVDTPGSMFDVAIRMRPDGDGAYISACGKHVHANEFGSGGDLYAVDVDLPQSTALPDPLAAERVALAAYPNPFNPQVTLRFTLPAASAATLEIFALDGRRLRLLVRGDFPAGQQTFVWDGRDEAGRAIGSGLYLARLTAATGTAQRQLILLK